ncbi:MAG: type VI secretion system contractile sheath small subunit [Polyangiaceae bacterium]
MSDGVPKSRVTLTYDTRQPEGREKPRELPFRLLVLGDLGGDKQDLPVDERRVRQLNGRNLGEVIKGLKIRVPAIALNEAGDRKLDVLVDSLSSFSPDSVLRTLTGQKATASVDAALKDAWGKDATADKLWPGDPTLMAKWALRENVVAFQKSFQNSKTLRAALKSFSTPATAEDRDKRVKAIEAMKTQLASKKPAAKPAASPAAPAATTPTATPTEGGTK